VDCIKEKNAVPVLPVCDAAGHLIAEGVVHTFAAMFYPDDDQRRRSFAAKVMVEVVAKRAKPQEIGALFPSVLLDALKADKHPLSPEGDGGRWFAGTIAGAQVQIVSSLSEQASQHASRAKGVYLMEWQQYRNGNPGTASYFNQVWARYEPVAHLWAAFNARGHCFIKWEEDGYTAAHDFSAFIEEAEAVRMWGENHYSPPRRNKQKPLLDPTLTWKPPPNWMPLERQGDGPPTGRFAILNLPNWMLEQLKGYPHDVPPARPRGRKPRLPADPFI
jgi:hypothetical protein